MKYVVVSHKHQKIAAEGDGVVVMYDYREGRRLRYRKRYGSGYLLWKKWDSWS